MCWLTGQGLRLEGRNLQVSGGEVDLLMTDHGRRVAVEVRTVSTGGDPIDAVGPGKRAHVRRLGGRLGVARVDYIGISLHQWGAEIHWVPG